MDPPNANRSSAASARRKSGFSGLHVLTQEWILAAVSMAAVALVLPLSRATHKWNMAVLALSAAAYYAATGLRALRVGSASPALSEAFNLARSGDLAEAEERLASLDSDRSSTTRLLVDLARAEIAIRRGDLDDARSLLDRVIEITGDGRVVGPRAASAAEAHGLRAWARAATGDLEGAMADAAIARSGAEAVLPAHAHAALAEAFVLQRRGDRAALAAQLQRERRLLLHGLDVRERALVRAMGRMLATPSTSVYRTPAGVEKGAIGGAEPPIAVWIGRVAPDLVAFAPRTPATSAPRATKEPSPSPAASKQASADRGRASREDSMVAIGQRLWPGLLLLVWGAVAHVPSGPIPINPWIGLAAVTVPALLYAWGDLKNKHGRSEMAELQALSVKVARGEHVDAELAAIAGGEEDVPAAFAELLRASVADSRARLHEALEHAEAARKKLRSESAEAAAGPYLLPAIGASRAYSLAALRRAEEAEIELAKLPADYMHLERSRFVVRLIASVAKGDIEAAGRLVEASPLDLSIGPRDELIRDLVRAATHPGGAGVAELSRLREELRDDDEQRLWIERVAPALLAHFERATMEHAALVPENQSAEDDRDDELERALSLAELEMIAEQEASAVAPKGRVRS